MNDEIIYNAMLCFFPHLFSSPTSAPTDPHESSFMYKEGSAILVPYTPHQDQARSPKTSLFSALIRTYLGTFLMAANFKLCHDILVFCSPQILK